MPKDDIFNKFSDNSRKVLINAQKIAKSINSAITSAHVLLAIVSTEGTLSHDILKDHLISADQIRLVISLRNLRPKAHSGLTVEVKKILKLAVKKASEFGHTSVDPEHILLAVASNKDCLGYQMIAQIGVNPNHIKQQIERLFDELIEVDEMIQKRLDQTKNMGDQNNQDFIGEPDIDIPSATFPTFQPAKSRSGASSLDYFATDLTNLAKASKLDPITGRDKEILRVMQILSRRTKNNPVLIGEPGVGKTAIVEGLAQKIVARQVPTNLQSKRILMLDLALLVAGTMYRGQFEERIKKVIDEIIKSQNTIIFIDELHTIVGAGSAEGSMDAANILKPALAKGQIRLIGATTLDDYRKNIEKDTALERRLQPVKVSEPTIAETISILKVIRPKYEQFHQIKITDEAILAAAELSAHYINDRFLPDKAIDLIDEAAAATKIENPVKSKNETLKQKLEEKLADITKQKDMAVNKEQFEKAAQLKTEEIRLLNELALFSKKNKPATKVIEKEIIAKIVSQWTGIPLQTLIKDEKDKFINLEKILKAKIVGQDDVLKLICRAVRRSKIGIANPNRPIGSFIFLGPTGVGKTELAKVIAKVVFGENALIKIDMSEFMERHNVSRLVGAPPGYVGYEEAGKLTETVRRNPYSLILFDEIEKAHPEIFNILLQILEDGVLTDAKGRKVNFKNTIIIMTSNIGVRELSHAAIGFHAKESKITKQATNEYRQMKEKVLEGLKESFRPEFLNRVDKVIVFKPLTMDAILKIVNLQLDELSAKLHQEGFAISFDKKIADFIATKGFHPEFGARPIRRTISDHIEDQLSEFILQDKYKKGDKIKASVEKGKIVFR